MSDPKTTYEERLARWQDRASTLANRERWISWSRLLVMGGTLALLWFSVQSRTVPLALPILGGVLFLGLVSVHDRVLRGRNAARRAVAFYQAGLRRLAGAWSGEGLDGSELTYAERPGGDHPFAADLDLFGSGSLFQLLCRARTPQGATQIAGWLLAPASASEVEQRQEAVRELLPRINLRERLATVGDDLKALADPDESSNLESWAAQRVSFSPGRLAAIRLVVLATSLANLAAVLAWWPGGRGPTALIALLLVQSIAYLLTWRPLTRVTHGLRRASDRLLLFRTLLEELEGAEFAAQWLKVRQAQVLGTRGEGPQREVSATVAIDRLRRLVDLLDAHLNPMFGPLAILLIWSPQVALAIFAWRNRHGAHVASWLQCLGEFEAMSSLSCFAYEQQDAATFPSVHERPNREPYFRAEGLGHPLIPLSDCIRNDIALAAGSGEQSPTAQAMVISGSNMSGKSTFLRACGLNVVLAMMGSVVRARELVLSPLTLGTSIRIQDSLQQGHSKFYAEIRRLRQILELASPTGTPTAARAADASQPTNLASRPPLFFLLDEILHGTNSHDRRIGAHAVIEALLDRGAVGLVTTHDLALAHLATEQPEDSRPERLVNKHFVDHLEGGKIVFDYTLRDGVVTRSNALALMREVGLDV